MQVDETSYRHHMQGPVMQVDETSYCHRMQGPVRRVDEASYCHHMQGPVTQVDQRSSSGRCLGWNPVVANILHQEWRLTAKVHVATNSHAVP